MKGVCSIYDQRPEMCRKYPVISSPMPSECTYTFPSSEDRQGDCSCGVGACCAIPREGGEPEGAPLPSEAGGEPCKHLVWVADDKEKTAAAADPDDVKASGVAFGTHNLLRILGQDE